MCSTSNGIFDIFIIGGGKAHEKLSWVQQLHYLSTDPKNVTN